MTDPTPPLLEVSGLRIRLQTQRGPADAVRGVSFSLARGETLGLIGESGCGKSLTAMALLGLLPESAEVTGSIRLNGRELVGLPDAALCAVRGDRIGMIFQEPMTALNPVHTIGDQIAEPLRLHRGVSAPDARKQAIALLDRVGIADAARRMDAYPHQFTGLSADEPTTALDVTIQQQILDLIGGLVAERGMALLLISHDLGVIAQNVARMLVMYGGTVVESGPTEAVFDHMAHPYTRGLFAARPRLGAPRGTRLATIGGSVPELVDLPPGCPFVDRCAFAIGECRATRPPAEALGDGHEASCLRLDAVAMAGGLHG
jgi:peptide/nickel transport system ATP-binding protein